MMYAQNGIAVNEFLGHKWRHVRDFLIYANEMFKTNN